VDRALPDDVKNQAILTDETIRALFLTDDPLMKI
jgi:hypothetical protein